MRPSDLSASIPGTVGILVLALAAVTLAAMPARSTFATGTTMDTTKYTVVFHVDTAGSDANDGLSRQTPVKTIGKAFALAKVELAKMIGVKVLIHSGRYHEPTIRMDGSTFDRVGTGALFVVEGEEKGKVIISGSERAGWEPSTWTEVSGSVYSHAWPYSWPYECGTWKPTDAGCIGWHREMVVFNGAVLRQAVTPNPAANYFYIDEAGKRVVINIGRALKPTDLVEIPAQLFLFRVSAKNFVAVKKLIFEHENSYIQSPLNDGDMWGVAVAFRTEGRAKTNDLLIEDCEFRANNSCALKLFNCNNVTIRRCKANNNGWKGIGFGDGTNTLVEDCETSFNCWRQAWSNGRGWDAGGVKVISDASIVTIRRHYADSNTYAAGIWLDWNNRNVTLDSCVFVNHLFDPLYIECSPGPTTITNCVVSNSTTGITSFGTSNNIIEGCRFEGVGRLINLINDGRSQCTSNRNFWVRRCYFNGSGSAFGSGDWTNFFNTLDIDSNKYYYTSSSITSTIFKNGTGGGVNFTQWQGLGKDVHSQWLTQPLPSSVMPSEPRRDARMRTGVLDMRIDAAPGARVRVVDMRGRWIAGGRSILPGSGVYIFDIRGPEGDRRAGPFLVY